ncbi:MAG: hypothetical protein A2284_10685 [Deltaproteobacteria bacterium RIFOXYA12_FULL_61_11]|nr:MAG: hypothetical protein A2284_10685 [Deltaproteobacteria bacterium RIFOXYA12_FULL_61_11]
MHNLDAYPFELRPLTEIEGGGYLITYPDFTECLADGETIEETMANGRLALAAVIETLEAKGLTVPDPQSRAGASGKFVARVPKTLHATLTARAKDEGVSLNTLVVALLAEGLGRRKYEEHRREE